VTSLTSFIFPNLSIHFAAFRAHCPKQFRTPIAQGKSLPNIVFSGLKLWRWCGKLLAPGDGRFFLAGFFIPTSLAAAPGIVNLDFRQLYPAVKIGEYL
jgi:hypothetical protein